MKMVDVETCGVWKRKKVEWLEMSQSEPKKLSLALTKAWLEKIIFLIPEHAYILHGAI